MRQELDRAVRRLRVLPSLVEPGPRALAVRRARKVTKRVRAVLPLLARRSARRGGDPSRAESGFLRLVEEDLRSANRLLSTTRDRDVRSATLLELADRVRLEIVEEERAALEQIIELARADPSEFESERRTADEAARLLLHARDLLVSAELPAIGWNSLRRRLRRGWNRIGQRVRSDLRSGCDERLHAGRKRCGRLEARLRLVEPCDPRRMSRRRSLIAQVHRLIGRDRDLALLAGWLENRENTGGVHAPKSLKDAIMAERGRIRRRLRRRIRRMPALRRRHWSRVGRPNPNPESHQP